MAGSLADVIDRNIVAITPEASLKAAKQLARNSGVSVLPVISEGKLVGVLDVSSLRGDSGRVSSAMMHRIFIEESGSIEDARKMLIKCGLTRLPVVDSKKSMRCLGTVSSSDLI